MLDFDELLIVSLNILPKHGGIVGYLHAPCIIPCNLMTVLLPVDVRTLANANTDGMVKL